MNPVECRRAFIKEMNGLCHRWNTWDVWSDWLILTSSSIYNSVHRDPDVEAEYLKAAGKYNKDEMDTMSRLLGITIQALEGSIHDFLGATFHELELHNKHIGQFFTPFELCKMMAAMMAPQVPGPGRLLKVGEPACGSGSMVLALAEIMRERECPQAQVVYYLKDLDHRAFRMAYIQTSLCGLPAEIELGDTLRMTTDRVWRTPGYYLHDIPTRLRIDAMMRALPQGQEDGMDSGTPKTDRPVLADVVVEDVREIPEAPELVAEAPEPQPRLDSPMVVTPDLILPRPGENFTLF